MQFAIVDIETTGGFASQHGITEIAIVYHNGKEIEGKYETLVNPNQPIPPFIVGMTGISNAMAASAPQFREVTEKVHNLLQNRIFVAHNVNFDYSFIKHHLQLAGFDLNVPKLCTIRLSRKVFPSFKKHGLGHLTRELGIKIENRHRAGGDAYATAQVLDIVLQNNGLRIIKEMLAKENKDYLLPPNLPKYFVSRLPANAGIYYFHNKAGKVIYVGKAKNIKKRVVSHFTGLDISKKRQDFLREIYEISHVDCPTEFIASLLESIEIKRLWPVYNKSQKRYEQLWGIYVFEDNKGYLRLAIDKKHKHTQPIISFPLLVDAHRELWKLVRTHELHPTLCFLDKTIPKELPDVQLYNAAVKNALASISSVKQSYIIKENEHAILVEKGIFIGMGTLASMQVANELNNDDLEKIKSMITPYAENEVLKSMIRKHVEKHPSSVITINN